MSGERGGHQDEPARGFPALPPGLVCSLGVSGHQDQRPGTRGWGQDGAQERQEAEESTEPLGLASPEPGGALRGPCLLPGLLLPKSAFSPQVSYTCSFLLVYLPLLLQGCSLWSI